MSKVYVQPNVIMTQQSSVACEPDGIQCKYGRWVYNYFPKMCSSSPSRGVSPSFLLSVCTPVPSSLPLKF